MLSEFVAWQPLSWLQTSANIGYFHTADFASRLYIYERSMLYSFSFPAFYGEGIRWLMFARANLRKKLSVLLKVGCLIPDLLHIVLTFKNQNGK